MNFEALEWLIKSILESFKCWFCNSKVHKKNLSLKAIEWNSVTLEIFCENCKNISNLKSEVISIDLSKHLNKNDLLNLKNSILNSKSEKNISDEEIVKLSKNLKKEKLNASDLFE